jgi:ubiquinone/menaquinone biosynthesis C-methylase UbiE
MKSTPYDSCKYADFWIGRDYEDKSEKIALNKFFKQINSKESILDIGAGFGRLANFYLPLFKKITLLDPSNNLLNEAMTKLKNPKVNYCIGNSLNLPKGLFDTVLMVRVSHHIPDIAGTFKAAHKVLKPNGYYIVEIANKNHFASIIKHLLKLDFSFINNQEPVDIRSEKAKKEGKIIFVNHNIKTIEKQLGDCGFKITDKLSVSNFRYPIVKKLIPLKILLFLENFLQKPLSAVNFGPSIFYLCQKLN